MDGWNNERTSERRAAVRYGWSSTLTALLRAGSHRGVLVRWNTCVSVMDFVQAGDTLAVTKLDCLARSITHLGKIIETLEGKGLALRVLGIDTAGPTGRLMLKILGGVARFEREVMLKRHREGIAKANGEGR